MAGERSDLGKIFITDGGIYDANTTYEKLTMVSYNNSTYITLRTVTGVTPSNDRINYGLMAQGFTATYLSSVTAEDVQGLVVEAGSETPAQSLINAIADRVANQLVSNSDLQDILSDYILKSAIANNLSITEEGKVLDARQGKALNDAITPLKTFTAVAPSEWTGSWDNTYTTPLTTYRLIMLTAEYNGQIMTQQMYPPSMLADKNVYLAYQDPTWNGRVKFTFNSAMTKCTVSQFNNFSKVKLYGIK